MASDLWKEHLGFALGLADAAAGYILPRFRNCPVALKPDGTEVTEADRGAERIMRELIADRFPDHDILGEEYCTPKEAGSTHRWILDPIDGTAWFTMGVPIFGTLIALTVHDNPVLGVINFPALQETIFAVEGGGCWFKTSAGSLTQVRVAAPASMEDAVISASGLQGSEMQPAATAHPVRLSEIVRKARKFKCAGDCLQHALVCTGKVHAAIDTLMKPWDIAALIPCIREAGGVVTDIKGSSENILWSGSLLTSCCESLHREIVTLLRPGGSAPVLGELETISEGSEQWIT